MYLISQKKIHLHKKKKRIKNILLILLLYLISIKKNRKSGIDFGSFNLFLILPTTPQCSGPTITINN